MAASAAAPGLFLCFTAAVLMLFVSLSAPTWNRISFLDVGLLGRDIHFGVFGYTGSKPSIGYRFDVAGVAVANTRVISNLTKILIIHPIVAGLAAIAVIFGFCGAAYHRTGTIFMSLVASLATLLAFLIFIFDMVIFGIARNRFRDAGFDAQYGNANWLTLGALIALMIGTCVGLCGIFGRYRHPRTY